MYKLPPEPNESYLPTLCEIAAAAGELAVQLQHGKFEKKSDGSWVGEGDRWANKLIVEELKRQYPNIPVVSEEGDKDAKGAREYFLVDPVDGTTNYRKGGKNWTVNIALIRDGKPVMGVVHVPAQNVMYAGEKGHGALRIRKDQKAEYIHVARVPEEGATVILSSHHAQGEMKEVFGVKVKHPPISASSSIKFCKIAEGSAHIYPRSGPTMEWDTAAGQALVEAAGGYVSDDKNDPLVYGKKDFRNGPFRVSGDVPILRKRIEDPGAERKSQTR